MKRILYITLMAAMMVSCRLSNTSSTFLGENELLVTRKYMGNFLEYRQTGFEEFAGPSIIWIKTSMDSTYGKIAAYGKKCNFNAGDRLYLRRIYVTPGIMGYWTYQIENDSSLFYEVMRYQSDKDIMTEELF
jgi:hypothetical protein